MEEFTHTDEATVARISDSYPRALSAYFLCIHRSDSSGRVTFTRDQIINECIRSWTKFKNDVRSLASLYLLNFLDRGTELDVELISDDSP